MEAGIHRVKVVGCFVGQPKEKKTHYFGIEFETENGESIEHAFYLTDKTKDKNIDTLLGMGFVGKTIADMANPELSVRDLFVQPDEQLTITIIDEAYTNTLGENKIKKVVQWVNVGKPFGLEKATHGQAVQMFASTIFDGLLMQKRKDRPEPKKEIANDSITDDLPF